MRWRARLHLWHRDVGFLVVGLTLVYAVSGIAVNHRHHWDYNRSKEEVTSQIGTPVELLRDQVPEGDIQPDPGQLARDHEDLLVQRILAAVEREGTPHKVLWRNPQRLSLFFGEGDTDTVDYVLYKGTAEHTIVRDHPIIRQFNFLHLNEPRGVWTLIADAYAVLLLFLALSGAIIVKGRRGLRGRGGVMLVIGLLIPLVALFFLQIR